MHRPTLDEVAALAGVGRGTVSRVINGSPQVSPEARAAVQKAVDALGYVPNRAARALVTRRTDSVALVVSESEERVFGEPFFAGIVRGVSSHLADTQMQLWLAMAQSVAERVLVERHLNDQHVDGVLLLSLHDDDPLPGLLAGRGLPTVLGGRTALMLETGTTGGEHNGHAISFVDNDNEGGARLAVEHLLNLGRRCVAAIAGPQDMGVGKARLRGYREALRRAAHPFDDRLVAYGDFSEASGAEAMYRLLHLNPGLDAVFAASDLMAAGAIRALREQGRAVPAQVAVVGFEDSAVARQTLPPLTTVHQSVEGMGREMARLLLARIAGGPAHSTVLDTHLVVRESA
ncbi:LacI family DNA-binding transcriptional regulator [Dactylosporangium matsuzakiense]|uniref:LacI family transcriptional regulator n=1 Tax=Dactylosporangium matsuzakiense TaxID=53360 RepID=A0A9W6KHI9_9ACTN|nr:LacI family transcriptional regulator [Dactylosporangium matsuzakiense]